MQTHEEEITESEKAKMEAMSEALTEAFNTCETNGDALNLALSACNYVVNGLSDEAGFKAHTKAYMLIKIQEM